MRIRHMLWQANTALLCLTMAMGLMGCEKLGATVSPPSPLIVWITAQDITPSIPLKRFLVMRDQMIPQIVLSRLRSRDELHILRVDSDPEDDVQRIPINGGNVGFDKEIADLFMKNIRTITQPAKYKGSTNIGGALAYAGRIAREVRAVSSQTPRVEVLIFTDGKLEGRQTGYDQGWMPGVHVWFWGVEREHEVSLKQWATRKMALGEQQLTIVRFSDWQTMAEVFGREIGRRFQDQQVLQRLYVLR